MKTGESRKIARKLVFRPTKQKCRASSWGRQLAGRRRPPPPADTRRRPSVAVSHHVPSAKGEPSLRVRGGHTGSVRIGTNS
ncbi:hypothetical protein EVAR_96423_1 [Eumeta japonica]|uniref:Uncharacterized protein n=1 Tax=Eumeta variegata TaxID=151549 RepID=A0A4C1WDX9_EUMVA|nr:hypothetical protein EVAR_96423_1 [Eumeta japonica]